MPSAPEVVEIVPSLLAEAGRSHKNVYSVFPVTFTPAAGAPDGNVTRPTTSIAGPEPSAGAVESLHASAKLLMTVSTRDHFAASEAVRRILGICMGVSVAAGESGRLGSEFGNPGAASERHVAAIAR